MGEEERKKGHYRQEKNARVFLVEFLFLPFLYGNGEWDILENQRLMMLSSTHFRCLFVFPENQSQWGDVREVEKLLAEISVMYFLVM